MEKVRLEVSGRVYTLTLDEFWKILDRIFQNPGKIGTLNILDFPLRETEG